MDIKRKSQYIYFHETDKSIKDEIRPVEINVTPFAILFYSEKGDQGVIQKIGYTEFVNIYGNPDYTSHITKKAQYELVKTGNKIYAINVSDVDETKQQVIKVTESAGQYVLESSAVVSKFLKGSSFNISTGEFFKLKTKYFGTYTNNLKFDVKFEAIRVGTSTQNIAKIRVFKRTLLPSGKEIFKLVEEISGYLKPIFDEQNNSLFIEDIQNNNSRYIEVKVNTEIAELLTFNTPVTFEFSFVRNASDDDFIRDKILSTDSITEIIDQLDEESEFKYFVDGGLRSLSNITPIEVSIIKSTIQSKCQELFAVYLQDFFGVSDKNIVKNELISHSSYVQQFYPDVIKYNVYEEEVVKEPIPVSVEVQKLSHHIDTTYGTYYPSSGLLQKIDQFDLTAKVRKADRDELYNMNVNPITKIFNEGIFVWGNKTTYGVDSKLEQLHVRRFLNFGIIRPLKSALLPFIFKPMTSSIITEIHDIIGTMIRNFKAIGQVDDMTYTIQTVGTEVQITLNIKPVNAIEYITVNMVVLPSEGITISG